MVTINLYRPKKFDYAIPFPSEWNELLPAELVAICKRQLANFKTVEEQIAAIFHDLLNIRAKKNKLQKGFFGMIDAEDIARNQVELLQFLYTENKLTEQLFPVIKVPGFAPLFRRGVGVRSLYGPESDFNNLTCGEFEDAEIFFYEFIATPKAISLAHIAAILWRPLNTPYISFDKKTNSWVTYDHEKMIKKFLRYPSHSLYAFFVWYAGCRAMLPAYFPTVYKKEIKKTSEADKESNQPDLLAFTKCIHAGAGPKNGSRLDVRRTLLKEFFMDMELEAQHVEKIKAEYGNK